MILQNKKKNEVCPEIEDNTASTHIRFGGEKCRQQKLGRGQSWGGHWANCTWSQCLPRCPTCLELGPAAGKAVGGFWTPLGGEGGHGCPCGVAAGGERGCGAGLRAGSCAWLRAWQGTEVEGEAGCVWFPCESAVGFFHISFVWQVWSCMLMFGAKTPACLC